jgi:hypothetical protein
VGKPERKRLLEGPKRRWVDNIKMVLSELRWGDMDSIEFSIVSILPERRGCYLV